MLRFIPPWCCSGSRASPKPPIRRSVTRDKRLHDGLRALDLDLGAETRAQLLRFLGLLEKWNGVFNLTAVRDPAQMVPRHLLDSLAVARELRGPRVLDVGTGAGLPGIPLALARPDLAFCLLDSNSKKTRFVTQAVHDLGIKNIEVVHGSVEKFAPLEKFNTVITRAFAAIPDMLGSCDHLCAAGGAFFAMKGTFPQEELAGLTDEYKVCAVKPLPIPGLEAARHLVVIEKR